MKFIDLISSVGGTVLRGPDTQIARVIDDSRAIRPGDLFIARPGTKTTGQTFIADALKNGAAAIVTQETPPTELSTQHSALSTTAQAVVPNANLALALMAHTAAGDPTQNITMLAVTGTKGKTTVAYLLRSVLKAAGHKVGMIGTVEIDDGQTITPAEMTTPGAWALVELFTRMKANGVTHCIMEVSSHALHQHRTAGIDFKVAIFTNLTGDHLDYHKTMEDYAASKALLFESLHEKSVAVVNVNDPFAKRMLKNCRARVVGFGFRDDPTVELGPDTWTARTVGWSTEKMPLEIRGPQGGWKLLNSLLVGKHNAYNLLSVICAATLLGVDEKLIFTTLEHATGAPGRLQRVQVEGLVSPCQVFVDYAHTHDALANVLIALRLTMLGSGRLICLFGCGGDRDRTKRPKMAAIAERLADLVILTSDNPRTEDPLAIIQEVTTGFTPNWQTTNKITIEPDRHAAIALAINLAQPNDVVLLAGKGHENYQILGTTKHHFDDVEEAQNALTAKLQPH